MARNPGAPARLGREAAKRAFSIRVVGEVVSELRRVTWPTRQETTRLTMMVLAVSAAIGLFLGLVDLGFSQLINAILGAA